MIGQDASNKERPPIFGFTDQWKLFHDRHHLFFECYPDLQLALNGAFSRTLSDVSREDWLIYTLGRACAEEFLEILLMSANGYGIGALKLLRALYERAVTMDFLIANPSDISAFIDYHFVAQRKLMRKIQESFAENPFSEEKEVEIKYQRVKQKFLITDCRKCETKKMNHTWHQFDLVTMASRTKFGKLVPAYYVPMGHSHSTVTALLSRTEEGEAGSIRFHAEAQPEEADMALHLAHNITLGVLESQVAPF